MNITSEKGRRAERQVAQMLRKRGMIISKMNYHSRFGEIDIIAETPDSLHFIEVKLRSQDAMVSGVQAVDEDKQKKIFLTALDYISKSHTENYLKHFDIAEVTGICDENGKNIYRVKFIPDAFDSEILNRFKGV
ncbi:MAG: YraN family protein [Clostridiales bacterium]|nr:YraN family protein [Candidatus Equinaster intestinalis]